MALQANLQREAVGFERMLRRFLDLAHLAQQEGVVIAYEYDKQEWATLAAQI